MFFHLKSLLYSIIFFITLQVLVFNESFLWYVAIFLVIFSIFVSRKMDSEKHFYLIPAIFSISTIIIFYLIDNESIKEIFSALAAIVFYFTFLGISRLRSYAKDKTARGIISGALFANIFLFYSGFYGLYINFSIPLWFLMLVFLAITFILSYRYFNLISSEKTKTLIYSLILGIAMAEISWVINFWPFGYLTTGVIALIFYYMFWDIAQSYFINKISRKRIVVNLIFFGLIIGLILASSRWQLAV